MLIADDQELIRQGLAALLVIDGDIEIVGEAANGLDAIRLVNDTAPDVVLMDIRMPACDGVEATRRIVSEHPQVKVLILTTFEEDEYILESLRAGASGYVLKNIPPRQLAASIRSVHEGVAQIDPSALSRMVSRAGSTARAKTQAADAAKMFTERELEVLKLIAGGKSNREIAKELNIAEATVKTHITSILSKLDVRDRTMAAIWAVEHLS